MIHLAEVERAAFAREPGALTTILVAIEAATCGDELKLGYLPADDLPRMPMACTRLAGALTALLCDPHLQLSDRELCTSLFSIDDIGHLFRRQFLRWTGTRDDGSHAGRPPGSRNRAAQQGGRLSRLMSLDARIGIDLESCSTCRPIWSSCLLSSSAIADPHPARRGSS